MNVYTCNSKLGGLNHPLVFYYVTIMTNFTVLHIKKMSA